jgi:hypothetical protein
VKAYSVQASGSPEEAIRLWPRAKPWIQEALDQFPTITGIDDVEEGLRRGTFRLWEIYDADAHLVAAFVTEIVSASCGRAVNVVALGGDEAVDAMEHFTFALRRYAKAMGCRVVCEMGRVGWMRVLARHGWERGPVMMMFEV